MPVNIGDRYYSEHFQGVFTIVDEPFDEDGRIKYPIIWDYFDAERRGERKSDGVIREDSILSGSLIFKPIHKITNDKEVLMYRLKFGWKVV